MSNSVTSKCSPVFTTTLVQLVVTLSLSLVVGFSTNWHHPGLVAVWVGGGIAAAVLMFAAWRSLWRGSQNSVPERVLMQLYGAEFSKLLASVLLLGLVFKYANALPAGLVIGAFALATVAGAIAMAVFGGNTTSQ